MEITNKYAFNIIIFSFFYFYLCSFSFSQKSKSVDTISFIFVNKYGMEKKIILGIDATSLDGSHKISMNYKQKPQILDHVNIQNSNDTIGNYPLLVRISNGVENKNNHFSIVRSRYNDDYAYQVGWNDTTPTISYHYYYTFYKGIMIEYYARSFKKNLPDLYRQYFLTGEIAEEGKLMEGARHDKWKTYHKNGNIESEGYYYTEMIPVDKSYNDSIRQYELETEGGSWSRPDVIPKYYKTDVWKYYNDKGILIRREWYDKKGSMIKSK